jgi:nicotinate-nucleotide adenylyltransferase
MSPIPSMPAMRPAGSLRIGLLGGTFDPPHQGHLKLAELAMAHLGLDEVRFIPTAVPPHKAVPTGDPDGAARLRLLEAALATLAFPARVEPLEVEQGGTSFTVTTLERLTARESAAWIFLMGSDHLRGFPGWRQAGRILELVSLAVAPRPGTLGPADGPSGLPELLAGRVRPAWSGAPGELVWLPGTGLDLASSALRADLGRGGSPAGIPPQVMAAILREKQYR